jgi:hypothetical protein
VASISISPVGILGLMASGVAQAHLADGGDDVLRPDLLALQVAVGVSSLSSTIWAMPERSRRSRKMRLPWSRRRLTQPIRTTCWPALAARNRRRDAFVRACLENRALRLCPLFACSVGGEKAASSARGTLVCMPVEKVFTVRIPDWSSSSPRMTMRRAVLSAASKDFLRRKLPSPSSMRRPARRSSRARASAAALRLFRPAAR